MFSFPWKKRKKRAEQPQQEDAAEILINGIIAKLQRRLNLSIPHEFSLFVPRAEIRRRVYRDGQLVREEEILLSSLTIVHAPRHEEEHDTD